MPPLAELDARWGVSLCPPPLNRVERHALERGALFVAQHLKGMKREEAGGVWNSSSDIWHLLLKSCGCIAPLGADLFMG